MAIFAIILHADVASACGEVAHHRAKYVPHQASRAPLEIGDSTSILGAPKLARLGIEADAHGCRQFSQGLQILSSRRRAHRLPHVVILALGANGAIQDSQIKRALRILGRDRVLALVTPPKSGMSAAAMRRAVRRNPQRVLLIDWARYSSRRGGIFAGDGLHPGYHGAGVFARMILRAVEPFAFPPLRRLRLPRTASGRKDCGPLHQGGRLLRVWILRGETHITCTGARTVVRRPPLQKDRRWQPYDLRAADRGAWKWAYVKPGGSVVIGAARTHARPSRTRAQSALT